MHPDDSIVARAAAAGDQSAFRTLVDRHSRGVYQVAFRITGTREDAEDVVQDTFVRAYRQLGRFEERASIATWLYRIGFNCAIDHVRRRSHRESLEAPEILDQREHHRGAPTNDDLLFAGQIASRVEGALQHLSTTERAAFVMRHFHECSIGDIATELGLNTSAAKHAVFRAVRKMRAVLRPLVEPGSGVTR